MEQIIGIPVFEVNRYSGIVDCDNIEMSIGTRLKEARKHAKLTQAELAIRSGTKQSSISDLEVGKTHGTTNLASLASALGVSALWLETGKGERAARATGAPEEVPRLKLVSNDERALQWITPEESRLLSNYRSSTAGWKMAIQDFAQDAEKDPSIGVADNKS